MNKKAHHHTLKLMGCRFTFSAVHTDPDIAWNAIRAAVTEVSRIENKISSWKSDSETSLINQNAGIRPVQVSNELIQLIKRSIKMSELTSGAFDICGEVSRFIWDFKERKEVEHSNDKINRCKELVNYKWIEIDSIQSTVYLKRKGMFIGFGGIGKGYAAERCKSIMNDYGVESGLINASGDIFCWGQAMKSDLWKIVVPDPEHPDQPILNLKINNGSIVTSGNYENFILNDGQRLSHIIDPRSGQPVSHIKSVTVTCPMPEIADAFATALTVMQIDEALSLINQLNHIECIIIDANDQKHFSKNLILESYEYQA